MPFSGITSCSSVLSANVELGPGAKLPEAGCASGNLSAPSSLMFFLSFCLRLLVLALLSNLASLAFLYFISSFSSVWAPHLFYSSANFPVQLLFLLHLQSEPALECSIFHAHDLQVEAAVAIADAAVANLTY